MPCVSHHGREWPVRVTWNCIRTQGRDEWFRNVKPNEIKQESLTPEPFPKDGEMKEAPNQAIQDVPLPEPDYLTTGNGSYKRLAFQPTVRNVRPRTNAQDDQRTRKPTYILDAQKYDDDLPLPNPLPKRIIRKTVRRPLHYHLSPRAHKKG